MTLPSLLFRCDIETSESSAAAARVSTSAFRQTYLRVLKNAIMSVGGGGAAPSCRSNVVTWPR